jgi:hypothetical protein
MRVIVGCERTQIVTQAFRALGHEAYSIDLLPTEGNPEFHFQMDIRDFSDFSFFDLAIFHPDCTYLAVSGNRTYANSEQRKQAIEFVKWIWTLPVKNWQSKIQLVYYLLNSKNLLNIFIHGNTGTGKLKRHAYGVEIFPC